jgi:3-phosphoshikimate 1-carboxyvinyltransferase
MKKFGFKVPENRNYEEFYFDGTSHDSRLTSHEYTVEGDWSGGAFLLVAGAIAGNITVKGLSKASAQADKEILKALIDCGAAITVDENTVTIGPAPLTAFSFDATDCPDLFPPLVALASYCEGISYIKGVSRLAHKESNRGVTLQEEFGKMGILVELDDDIMRVHGGSAIRGASVRSHHDHRIAMACAVAALNAEGETVIGDAEAVNKSFPDFYDKLKSLGANVNF